jgi:hypothetical protein
MVFAPDCAAGISYWSQDHTEYYSRFAAHNTVVVDGVSDYRNMRGTQAFEVNTIYPSTDTPNPLYSEFTLSDVTFSEPSTDATQQRFTGTVRTGESTGYFIDIFRSSRNDGKDKKHEYLFHSQGEPMVLKNFDGNEIPTIETDELSSTKGDLKGYDYFEKKKAARTGDHFIAHFKMPSILGEMLCLNVWMMGNQGREIFCVEAPYSRAINDESVPEKLYRKPLPTLVVRQNGEARTRPFVAIMDAFNESEGRSVIKVGYFSPDNENPGFVGLNVHSVNDRYDLIFNDENPDTENQFYHGEFKGRCGVMSKVGEEFHSILLSNGTLFEHGNMRIEIPGKPGDVLVKQIQGGFEIHSPQPFTFTIPLDENEQGLLEGSVGGEKLSFNGQVVKKDKIRLARFELPALNRVKLKAF